MRECAVDGNNIYGGVRWLLVWLVSLWGIGLSVGVSLVMLW